LSIFEGKRGRRKNSDPDLDLDRLNKKEFWGGPVSWNGRKRESIIQ